MARVPRRKNVVPTPRQLAKRRAYLFYESEEELSEGDFIQPAPKKSIPAAKDKRGPLSERLARTLFDEKVSDVVFLVGPNKEKVAASKLLLTSVSEVFEQMFFGDVPQPVPVLLPDATPEAFRAVVKYAYTDKTDFSGETIGNVLYLAKKYMMDELYEKAVNFAKHAIDASNVFDFIELSGCMPELKQCCIDVIVDNMLATEAFLANLDKTILARILDHDSLPVVELDLFNLCVRWAKAQLQKEKKAVDSPKAIREALGELLFKIRFPIMEIGTFTGQPTKSGVLTDENLHLCARFLKCDHCGMASTNAV